MIVKNFEEVFQLVDTAVVAKKNRHLKDIELAILRGAWQGKKYHEIAETYGYTAEYLKQDVGPKLWKLLSEVLGEKVSKTNFQAALERQWLFSDCDRALSQSEAVVKLQEPIPSYSELIVKEMSSQNFKFMRHKEVNADERQRRGEALSTKVFVSNRAQETDTSLAQQLYTNLQAAGKEVFMVRENVLMRVTSPQRLSQELERCDCFLLVVPAQSTVSKIVTVTEEVQRTEELCDSQLNSRFKVLAIYVVYPICSP